MALSSVCTFVCVCVCVCGCVCVAAPATSGHGRASVCRSPSLSLSLSHSLTVNLSPVLLSLQNTRKKQGIRYLARSVPWEHGFALYYVHFLFLQDLARSVRVQARSGSLLHIYFSVLSSIS